MMIAPYKWLCDYVDMDIPPEALAQKLIMTGTAVDDCEELGAGLDNVIVGHIETIRKHPDADKLSVCEVGVGTETLQIVCGAGNIFEGALVPVAMIGASLPNGITIAKSKLRGVFSFGMLCSGQELNLGVADYPGAEADGIMIIREDVPLGTPLRELLGLNDTVLSIEVGANRPDCLSMIGVARECAASLDRGITLPEAGYSESGGSIGDYVRVDVRDSDLCPRYIARAVRNVKIGPSPKWLRDRLTTAGVRAINNIVDITNFVMLETGQPMHAFDHQDIRGGEIVVRRAAEGEKIITLDARERALSGDMLMICDAAGPIGIAGVMGGENSGIKDDTATVIFESAKFLHSNIRRTARSLGLQTESAMRFSKGIDTAGCKTAMDRALSLVQQLGCGEIVSGEIDILSADLSPRRVVVDAHKINGKLGTDITPQAMAELLNRVFIATELKGETLVCDIPSFRGDVSLGEDIAEEVARLYGYGNIPLVEMVGEVRRGVFSGEEKAVDKARSLLRGLGCYEAVTYSFGSMADIEKLGVRELKNAVKILNPLGDDQATMRTSMAPDMLKVVANNINKKVPDIRLFESGRVYLPAADLKELPEERKTLCIALCGDEDFFSLKGVLENLFDAFGIKGLRYMNDAAGYYHPGRRASVYAKGSKLGEFGEIYPDVAAAFGISRRVYLAELGLKALCEAADDVVKYTPLPKYPAVERDVALIVNADVTSGSLLECIRNSAGEFFESASLFDVYTGDKLGSGKKSLAYNIVFRGGDRTLMDEEVNAARDAVVAAAGREYGAKLRD